MRESKKKRVAANVMAFVMAVSAVPFTPEIVQAQQETKDSEWGYNGAAVQSTGGALQKNALIQGESAEIYEDVQKGNVLRLFGETPQSGVLMLPAELYQNVTDGFTISMEICVDESAGDYTRLFQSSCCEPGSKGAPWNSPGISIDLGAGNLWRSEVFVGNNKDSAANVENRAAATTAVSRGEWHTVTMSVGEDTSIIKVDNEVLITSPGEFSKLFGSEKYLSAYQYNYIGDSIYGDSSIKAMVDNVKFYNSSQVLDNSTLQVSYDFEQVEKVQQNATIGDADTYTDGKELSVVKEVQSPDASVQTTVLKDDTDRYFYSVKKNGTDVIYASQLGIMTKEADFTSGAAFTDGEVQDVTDSYTLYNGKHQGEINDTCREYTFTLTKNKKNLKVFIRVYDDGVAYQYAMDEGAEISMEASEFVFPDQAKLWTYAQPNVTYEGTYMEYSMNQVYRTAATYTVPTLVNVNQNYVLITEGAVFSKEQSYCSSYLKTTSGNKNLKWVFGNKQGSSVKMDAAFETPWRIAVIGQDLNDIVNSDIVTSVNPDAKDCDWSWVKPGRAAWSWWSSTGDDPIAYEPQKAYIDFAAENGWEYVCLDYGWILWDNYKEKVKELTEYAEEKGVSIWLWYGVNDVGHTAAGAYPDHSLLNEKNIRSEFEWANSIGVKGVKVDYYESDNQDTMNQMYLCADIAADNQLMVLFHGCTNPAGEERTFPNVISYEAVYGAEYYKWRTEPSTANIITYLFTRNAVGSADFTPTALPVGNIDATCGFMLATSVYLESGIVHFAENVHVYEGYEGLSLMNELPASWDETVVLEGEPGKYGSVARKKDSKWMVASLAAEARTAEIALDFLEEGKEYYAYIYSTKEDESGVKIDNKKVTAADVLHISLKKDDGVSVILTEEEIKTITSYEEAYNYYEAEDAKVQGNAVVAENQYASGMNTVGFIGKGTENAVSCEVEVPETGVYELKMFYVSGAERRFEVCINGSEVIRTERLNSGDWVTVDQRSIYVNLQKGKNTILFANAEKDAPNLDRIALSKTVVNEKPTESDETEDSSGAEDALNYQYKIYEAEQAVVAGAVKNAATVGWLGSSEQSYVLFDNVWADQDGIYYLMLKYFSGEDREVYLSINEGEDILVKCPSSGAWSEYASAVYLKVELKEGNNTIKIYNPHAFCPDLDAIGLSTERVKEEVTNSEKDTETQSTEIEEDKSKETDTAGKTVPETGDGSGIILFAAAMLCSAVVIGRRRGQIIK